MRIISGTEKGRKLLIPKNLPARPTTDFAKESLFNILRNRFYFDEIKVLDLYSGTGSISYEFASRGVPSITSVESHAASARYIEKVAKELEFPIDVLRMDVFKYLDSTSQKFDIIFCDPPYDLEVVHFERIIHTVFRNELLNKEGILIIEHHKKTDLSVFENFENNRKYGDSMFSFFLEK